MKSDKQGKSQESNQCRAGLEDNGKGKLRRDPRLQMKWHGRFSRKKALKEKMKAKDCSILK